jgi:methyltransferase (TIGR00027 family)
MEGASQTAILTAQFRAAHALIDDHPIFEDRFALTLTGSSAADVIGFMAANAPESCAHVVRLFVPQRSRFMDEEVERAVSSGVDQYVDLGAGLDSFAWRRSDLMAGLALFEVDHPATQEWKRGRLAATGLPCPPNLHFVGADFRAAGTLGERLTAASFDPERASIWSWLGVIQYLSLEAVQSTLHAVARLAAPGSKLVASYGVTDDFMEPASVQFTALTRAFTAQIGEPQITWVAPDEMEAVARAAGWPRVRSVDPLLFAPWFAGRTDGLEPVRAEWLLIAERPLHQQPPQEGTRGHVG